MLALMRQVEQHGLSLVEINDRVEVRKGTKVLSFDKNRDRAVQKALLRIEEDRLRNMDKLPQDREPVLIIPVKAKKEAVPVELPAEKPPSRSVVKTKYREKYKKNGDFSCGDTIATELALYVGVMRGNRREVDVDKLKEVAVANGVWDEKYARLNVGMQRMNIGNRLRTRHEAGDQVDIGGAIWQKTWE
jgi:hypothetical protein